MSQPGTIRWFAVHEARLAWRDWLSLMTAGRRRRVRVMALGFVACVVFVHGLAWLMLAPAENLAGEADTHTLVVITATLVLAFSLMLSQAWESVTRAFHARGDLGLILSCSRCESRRWP
jgi:ABC-2 type transport system permease protein